MPVDRFELLQKRIATLSRRSAQLELWSKKYWLARRLIFVCGLLLTLLVWHFAGGKAAITIGGLVVIAFSWVAVYHNRVRESIKRTALMIDLKQIQIARINLDWDHLPATAQSTQEQDHPFAVDIDVTGERSLHRLLDTAVTKEGSLRLKAWLLTNAPDAAVIAQRQSLVQELQKLSLFRDKLQMYAAIVSAESASMSGRDVKQALRQRWESHTLIAWLEQAPVGPSLKPTVISLAVLALVNIVLVVLGILGLTPLVWPIVFLLYIGVMVIKQGRITSSWGDVQELEQSLRRFGAVFEYLEIRGCNNLPELQRVCGPFLEKSKKPSRELTRIGRIAAALGLRTNALLWLLVHAFVPWDFFFTYRLEKLRSEISALLPRWLDTWYELEALNSLANFAWLNTKYSFPEIVSGKSLFAGQQIGHPLLRPDHKVCNDFELNEQNRIVILTGSNMAGKSTFLRSIGLNTCLAYAGAPVNAERLKLSLFRLFTCIKVSDSVQDGLSYFYAEVRRLKLLLDAVELRSEQPVLFLIDEIFRGTNNRERHIGSEAFIRSLSNNGHAMGLIATHDLELTKLADNIAGISNFHFREEIGDGKMVFDYLLRDGPCPTTNALKIMRIEGLPVDV
ncbi:MAG TPA: hypothetical protein VLB68_05805 [Pyrinomonadaceae bacterium]|nr:hypothetical protein [Pyrinomonadaceae bacterium]